MNPIAGYVEAASGGLQLAALGAALAALFGAGVWAGYAWQADEVEDARAALNTAARKRDEWKELAEGRKDAVDAQNQANAAAVKESKLAQAAAEASVIRANAVADRMLKAKAEYDRLIAAEKAGICRAQLEAPLCGSPLR